MLVRREPKRGWAAKVREVPGRHSFRVSIEGVPLFVQAPEHRRSLIVREGHRASPADVAELEAAWTQINVAIPRARDVYGNA